VILKSIHPIPVAVGNFIYRLFPRDLFRPPVHERIPEASPADREADEPRDSRGGGQPLVYFSVVLAAANVSLIGFNQQAIGARFERADFGISHLSVGKP